MKEDLRQLNLSPSQVAEDLRKLLESKHPERRISRWITVGLRMIKPDKLTLAIRGEIDAFPWLTNHLHLCNVLCKPFWVVGLRVFWEQLEPALTDPKQILDVLTTRKDVAEIINTPEGIIWLNQTCSLFYHFLRLYTFGANCLLCARPIDACGDPWTKLSGPATFAHTPCFEAWNKFYATQKI